jgi:hypothetical protein
MPVPRKSRHPGRLVDHKTPWLVVHGTAAAVGGTEAQTKWLRSQLAALERDDS